MSQLEQLACCLTATLLYSLGTAGRKIRIFMISGVAFVQRNGVQAA